MIIAKAAVFAAGYVIGARAGRERYAQIIELAGRASERLEAFSERHAAGAQASRAGRPRARA